MFTICHIIYELNVKSLSGCWFHIFFISPTLCLVHLLFVRHLIKHKFNFGSNFKNFKLKESSGCVCTFVFFSPFFFLCFSSCSTLYNLLVRMFLRYFTSFALYASLASLLSACVQRCQTIFFFCFFNNFYPTDEVHISTTSGQDERNFKLKDWCTQVYKAKRDEKNYVFFFWQTRGFCTQTLLHVYTTYISVVYVIIHIHTHTRLTNERNMKDVCV